MKPDSLFARLVVAVILSLPVSMANAWVYTVQGVTNDRDSYISDSNHLFTTIALEPYTATIVVDPTKYSAQTGQIIIPNVESRSNHSGWNSGEVSISLSIAGLNFNYLLDPSLFNSGGSSLQNTRSVYGPVCTAAAMSWPCKDSVNQAHRGYTAGAMDYVLFQGGIYSEEEAFGNTLDFDQVWSWLTSASNRPSFYFRAEEQERTVELRNTEITLVSISPNHNVPEPGGLVLLCVGLMGLAMARRYRNIY